MNYLFLTLGYSILPISMIICMKKFYNKYELDSNPLYNGVFDDYYDCGTNEMKEAAW